jgi:hypothetical protein
MNSLSRTPACLESGSLSLLGGFHPIPVSCCYCAADDVSKSEACDERRGADSCERDKGSDAWRREATAALIRLAAQQNIGADYNNAEYNYGCENLFSDRHERDLFSKSVKGLRVSRRPGLGNVTSGCKMKSV